MAIPISVGRERPFRDVESTMFRKCVLSVVCAVGTVGAWLATPAPADASPGLLHRRYDVMVSRSGVWEKHGTYRFHLEAELVARRLRHQGFSIEIREH